MYNRMKINNDLTLLQQTLGLTVSKSTQESVRMKANPEEDDEEEEEEVIV
jgi:hypothetical protein